MTEVINAGLLQDCRPTEIRLAEYILGANPIAAQIATQVSQVFVLPLVIVGIFLLTNNKKHMGEHKAGLLLNIGMILSLIFSCVISYTAIQAIYESLVSLN